MVYASSLYSMGGVSYDIVAQDRTKEAIDSATQGVDSVGVHYSNTMTDMTFSFNQYVAAAKEGFALLQEGWNQTVQKAIDYQSEMQDLSNMLGISYDAAQKWRWVAIETDTDLGSLSMTMRYVTQRYTDMSQAGDTYRDKLAAIGVTVKDVNGNWRDTNEVYMDILTALHNIPAGAERANAAFEVLGRNWYRVAEAIEKADTAQTTFQTHQPPFKDSDMDSVEKFKIKFHELTGQIEEAGAKLGLFVINILEEPPIRKGSALDQVFSFFGDTFGDRVANLEAAKKPFTSTSSKTGSPAFGFENPYAGMSEDELSLYLIQQKIITDTAALEKAQTKETADALHLEITQLQTQYTHMQESITRKSDDNTRSVRDNKLALDELIYVTLPDLQRKYDAVKFSGDTEKIHSAADALDKAKNKVTDLRKELGLAGAAADTFNEKFSNLLTSGHNELDQFGNLVWKGETPPDLAGYSQFGNMTEADLLDFLKKHGILEGGQWQYNTGSRNEFDTALTYYNALKSGSPLGTGTDDKTKSATTQTPDKTYKDTGDALTTLTKTTNDEFKKQKDYAEAFYTALVTAARAADQYLIDIWTQTANAITNMIAYEQVITVNNGKASATPMVGNYQSISLPAIPQIGAGSTTQASSSTTGETTTSGGGTQTVKVEVQTYTPDTVKVSAVEIISNALGNTTSGFTW